MISSDFKWRRKYPLFSHFPKRGREACSRLSEGIKLKWLALRIIGNIWSKMRKMNPLKDLETVLRIGNSSLGVGDSIWEPNLTLRCGRGLSRHILFQPKDSLQSRVIDEALTKPLQPSRCWRQKAPWLVNHLRCRDPDHKKLRYPGDPWNA